jgi:hypothetical protein
LDAGNSTVNARSPQRPSQQESRRFQLRLSPQNSEYRLAGGPWLTAPGGSTDIAVPPDIATVVEARNPVCCEPRSFSIPADRPPGAIEINLDFLPATLIAQCPEPGVSVRFDGKAASIDNPSTIVLKNSLGSRRVDVEFFDDKDFYWKTQVEVHYNQTVTVTCRH